MQKRRHLTVFLILAVLSVALLAACGGKPATGESAPAGSSAEPSATTNSSPTPTPVPTPTPTPTAPPVGTLVGDWVSGIPEYVPRFAYGVIDHARSKIMEGSISTVFDLKMTGVKRDDLSAYSAALEKAGYKVAAGEIGNTYTLIATMDLKYGTVTLVITLNEAEEEAEYALEAPV